MIRLGMLSLGFAILTACAFNPGPTDEKTQLGQGQFDLTVDWRMDGDTSSDPKLKAVRLLSPSGDTYSADLPVTLPAAVPQSLILTADFSDQLPVEAVDFLRAKVRVGDRGVFVTAQLVSSETKGAKRSLTFQVTGLNAAFKSAKSSRGRLRIEIFKDDSRMAALEVDLRTPPSDVQIEQIPIQSWETSNGETSEYLKPVIKGRQLNLLRVLKVSNSENLPVQVQIPRRPKGTVTQWTNTIAIAQASCSYSVQTSPRDEVLADDVLILPFDDRFIAEAEALVQTPELTGDLAATVPAGEDRYFGLYGLGSGMDVWMDSGPSSPDLRTTTAVAGCGRRCTNRVCEPTRNGFFEDLKSPRGCSCEAYETTYSTVNVTVGTDRRAVLLSLPEAATLLPLRFGDIQPNQDGEVRMVETLQKTSEVTWLK